MPYLAVDEDKDEFIFDGKPYRDYDEWNVKSFDFVKLPSGTIKKLIGRELSWNDDPVELTEEMVKEPEKQAPYFTDPYLNTR